ncbi:hypothetical protein K491DRAFT_423225 [Lophiostoma macrostomum CBS 122681]|uniref:Uncharacterized protein n=1 Tax=Lophiostoma macrostomum CBS 122681 TaxID=1314788 RepID=A0A6A6T7E5_9PLEO|nr:hypothetical protein K491DRAFT_423225 [Lophiostoma macrostomum CBS 122681]
MLPTSNFRFCQSLNTCTVTSRFTHIHRENAHRRRPNPASASASSWLFTIKPTAPLCSRNNNSHSNLHTDTPTSYEPPPSVLPLLQSSSTPPLTMAATIPYAPMGGIQASSWTAMLPDVGKWCNGLWDGIASLSFTKTPDILSTPTSEPHQDALRHIEAIIAPLPDIGPEVHISFHLPRFEVDMELMHDMCTSDLCDIIVDYVFGSASASPRESLLGLFSSIGGCLLALYAIIDRHWQTMAIIAIAGYLLYTRAEHKKETSLLQSQLDVLQSRLGRAHSRLDAAEVWADKGSKFFLDVRDVINDILEHLVSTKPDGSRTQAIELDTSGLRALVDELFERIGDLDKSFAGLENYVRTFLAHMKAGVDSDATCIKVLQDQRDAGVRMLRTLVIPGLRAQQAFQQRVKDLADDDFNGFLNAILVSVMADLATAVNTQSSNTGFRPGVGFPPLSYAPPAMPYHGTRGPQSLPLPPPPPPQIPLAPVPVTPAPVVSAPATPAPTTPLAPSPATPASVTPSPSRLSIPPHLRYKK